MMQFSPDEAMDLGISETTNCMRTELVRLAEECALDEALRIYVFSRFSCEIDTLGEHDLADVSDLFLPIIIDMKSQLSGVNVQ